MIVKRGIIGITIVILSAIIIVILAILCFLFGICPFTASSLGDYGDAPDGTPTGYDQVLGYDPIFSGYALTGNFPTLTANDGAWVSNTNTVTLGPSVSNEVSATDPNDPDGKPNILVPRLSNLDFDDGLEVRCPLIPPFLIGSYKCEWFITVHSNVGGTFYLNLLVDLNRDGMWGSGHPEWIIENQQVIIDPTVDNIAKIPLPEDANNDLIWMRIAITTQPIQASDWDGTGHFTAGEIEDRIIFVDREDGHNFTPHNGCSPDALVC